jgi:NADH:ubiquinone oxidoreductase subunit 5 (subunit L)/multisubunit Na+/H+ antiporter MnhA subunit
MGGLAGHTPATYALLALASISLCGLPCTAGCDSKDAILELGGATYVLQARATFLLAMLTAGATALYSSRLVYLALLAPPCASAPVLRKPRDVVDMHGRSSTATYQRALGALLVVLALAALVVGDVVKPVFAGLGAASLGTDLADEPVSLALDAEFGGARLKLLSVVLSVLGVFGAVVVQTVLWPEGRHLFTAHALAADALGNR